MMTLNKLIEFHLGKILLDHKKMKFLMTHLDKYLVLFSYDFIYLVEWREEKRIIDRICCDRYSSPSIECIPNSNDLYVNIDRKLYYFQFDSVTNELNQIELIDLRDQYCIEIKNEYLVLSSGDIHIYKLEDLMKEKKSCKPILITCRKVKIYSFSTDNKYLVVTTNLNELIVYKMSDLNEPFSYLKWSERIWDMISNGQYISIKYGDEIRLLTFKINDDD